MNWHLKAAGAGLAVGVAAFAPQQSRADEGGVSFWVPGFFGSLAAAPQQPGWSLATVYYHTSVKAGAEIVFARHVHRGGLTTNFTGNLVANLNADADLGIAIPQYVFATPVLGGQAAVAMLIPGGRNKVSTDATLTAALGPLGFTTSAGRTDTTTGFGDLVPQASLRWNFGVHNVMTYITGDIPVGAYDPNRLANLGIGHGAIDGGAGYTYFNPQTGHEFSAVGGLTYNFKNNETQYKNGVDFHLDMGASQFLSKQLFIGVVGYAYQQLTGDSGSGDRAGRFQIACVRRRAANRLPLPDRDLPGLFEPQGLQGVRRRKPARRVERVAHVLDLACGATRARREVSTVAQVRRGAMADCEKPHMRLFLMGFALLIAVMFDSAGHTVQAQPYCAMYDNGTRDCAIPTLSSCEQSVSGVGGYCAPDTTSQLRPNLIDRLRSEQMGQDAMPPPPCR